MRSKSKAVKLAGLIFEGHSIAKAGPMLDITSRQAYRLSRTDEFQETLKELKTQAISEALAILSRHTKTAVGRLVKLIIDDDIPAQTQCAAARSILDGVIKLGQYSELESRLTAIEQHLDGNFR